MRNAPRFCWSPPGKTSAIVLWDRAEVAGRLDFLRRADPGFARFGSAAHRYLLNQPLTPSEVAAFESQYGVSLPEDYRSFLLEVGDGGAGPFYGVFRLDRSDLPARCDDDLLPGFLAGEFPHAQPWNDVGESGPESEEEYCDPAHIRGSLNLTHQGCGYMVRLVLNGPQRGTLWEDGRCSDMGITPFAPGFAAWYLRWLTRLPTAPPRT
jgi:SMI1 / KNR4 family (SUKH-1)